MTSQTCVPQEKVAFAASVMKDINTENMVIFDGQPWSIQSKIAPVYYESYPSRACN